MVYPQAAILGESGSNALYLQLQAQRTPEALQHIRHHCAALPSLYQGVQQADPQANLLAALSFAPDFWRLLSAPESLDAHLLSAEPKLDIFLHIHSLRADLCFILARQFLHGLSQYVSIQHETHASRYIDGRACTDSSQTSLSVAQRSEQAIIRHPQALCGGSHLLLRHYRYQISTESQAKALDQQLLLAQGLAQDSVKHSLPYRSSQHSGFMLLAYAAQPQAFQGLRHALSVVNQQDKSKQIQKLADVVLFTPSIEQMNLLTIENNLKKLA